MDRRALRWGGPPRREKRPPDRDPEDEGHHAERHSKLQVNRPPTARRATKGRFRKIRADSRGWAAAGSGRWAHHRAADRLAHNVKGRLAELRDASQGRTNALAPAGGERVPDNGVSEMGCGRPGDGPVEHETAGFCSRKDLSNWVRTPDETGFTERDGTIDLAHFTTRKQIDSDCRNIYIYMYIYVIVISIISISSQNDIVSMAFVICIIYIII